MANKNYGFKIPKIEKEHHVFGGLSRIPNIVLQPDGQWDSFLPTDEFQNHGFETYNCTSYGTNHAIATNMARTFEGTFNFSERYIGIESNTDPNSGGNDPHLVAETIRTICGEIPDNELPFDATIDSVEKYYSPKPMIEPYLSHGKQWLVDYSLAHDWVWNGAMLNKQALLIEALKYSCCAVSVYAWQQNADGLYIKPKEAEDNHWVTVYGFEEGKFWKIFDSYDKTHKKLIWDFDFGFAKRYYVKKNLTTEPVKKNKWYLKIGQMLKNFWKYLGIGGIILISAAGIYGSRQQYRNYPNYSLTPGLIRTNDIQDICGHNTGTYRKTTETMKNKVYQEYGIKTHPAGTYEIDHYFPLGIGGADDIKNLWPQPAPEFHAKDKVENQLRIKLCKKEITQQEAINTINHWDKQNLGGIDQTEDQDDE